MAANAKKIERKPITLKDQIDILDALKSKKQSEVATQFGRHPSVISKIKKDESKIRDEALKNGNLGRKRQRASTFEDVS